MIGGLAAEHRVPSYPQATEAEIAHMRDLGLQFARWRGHGQAAQLTSWPAVQGPRPRVMLARGLPLA
jgi:hypothetical protein